MNQISGLLFHEILAVSVEILKVMRLLCFSVLDETFLRFIDAQVIAHILDMFYWWKFIN